MGGFHLHHSFNSKINAIVKDFKFFSPKNVAPCHCTGESATRRFKENYPDNFHEVGTGIKLIM